MGDEEKVTRIGKYDVNKVLGRGGMGVVYSAVDPSMGRKVAIKTLTGDWAQDETMRNRQRKEAEAVGKLSHPNIVTIYEFNDSSNPPYIVMELVDGESLDNILHRGRPGLLKSLLIIEDVCRALDEAHRHHIIHRDVKPANVIVQANGSSKLLDFGIARQETDASRLTRTGFIIGTVPYMAPERLLRRPVDNRADIFAVGCMLFEMLSGRRPFDGDDVAVIHAITHDEPPTLSSLDSALPAELDPILSRALAKSPDERYLNAADLLVDLQAVRQNVQGDAISDLFNQAKHHYDAGELELAQKTLAELFSLDPTHNEARRLRDQAQRAEARRAREKDLLALRSAIDEAELHKDREHLIDLLEQACSIADDDADLQQRLKDAVEARRRSEQIDGLLQQIAGHAKSANFERAHRLITQASEIDAHDIRVASTKRSLEQSEVDYNRRRETSQLVDKARGRLAAGDFAEALTLLDQAEQIIAFDAEAVRLRAEVRKAQQSAALRESVRAIDRAAADADDEAKLEAAIALADEELQKLSGESALLERRSQLSARLERLREERVFEESLQKFRALIDEEPLLALIEAEELQPQHAADKRLAALIESAQSAIANWSAEQTSEQCLKTAEALLKQQRPEAANKALAKLERKTSKQAAPLRRRIEEQRRAQQKQAELVAAVQKADAALAADDHETALRLLEPLSGESDAALKRSLARAHKLQQEHERLVAQIADEADKQLRRGAALETLARLNAQPENVRRAPRTTELLQSAREASLQEPEVLLAFGAAYAQLSTNQSDPFAKLKTGEVAASLIESLRQPLTNRRARATQEV